MRHFYSHCIVRKIEGLAGPERQFEAKLAPLSLQRPKPLCLSVGDKEHDTVQLSVILTPPLVISPQYREEPRAAAATAVQISTILENIC